jgi:sulfotransferase family protein
MSGDEVRVLLVAGTGQNGATLLSRVLGGVPGFFAIGEIGHLWDKALIDGRECGCGRSVHACPFWSAVGDEAFGGWDSVDANHATRLRGSLLFKKHPVPHPFALPFILYPGLSSSYRKGLEEYGELMERLYRAVASVSGAQVLVDSMKVPAHVYAMSLRPGIDGRVLHLVRDPHGVAYSNQKVVKRQGERHRVRRRPAKASLRWTWINESFAVLARHGVPTEVVRYESFVRHPQEEVRRIAAFAGVRMDEQDPDAIRGNVVRLPEDHLVAGNRMRFAKGEIELRVDDEWARKLTPAQRRSVSLMTWPLLRRYGYRSSEDPFEA